MLLFVELVVSISRSSNDHISIESTQTLQKESSKVSEFRAFGPLTSTPKASNFGHYGLGPYGLDLT